MAECAVVGADDALKGHIPVAFVVPRAGFEGDATMAARVIARVREDIGAVAALRTCHVVAQLPKTRSGKILRNVLRKLASGEDVAVPPTIEDPAVIPAIRAVLAG